MRRFAAYLLVLALASGCAAVPAQHVGVLETFGKVHETTWGPGLHAWFPWIGVHRVNCRTMRSRSVRRRRRGKGSSSGST